MDKFGYRQAYPQPNLFGFNRFGQREWIVRAVGVPLAQLSWGGLGAAKALARVSEPLQAAISRHGPLTSSPRPQRATGAFWCLGADRWVEGPADCVWRRYGRLLRLYGGIAPIARPSEGRPELLRQKSVPF